MEWKKSSQVIGFTVCLLLMISEISSLPFYSPEDYEQAKIIDHNRLMDVFLQLWTPQFPNFKNRSPELHSIEDVAGIREVLDEIDRQGGLTSAIVPRAYNPNNPNHRMMRKSQRSNSLRLRFGKRSVDFPRSGSDDADWPGSNGPRQRK